MEVARCCAGEIRFSPCFLRPEEYTVGFVWEAKVPPTIKYSNLCC
jgi:hypothetical protein